MKFLQTVYANCAWHMFDKYVHPLSLLWWYIKYCWTFFQGIQVLSLLSHFLRMVTTWLQQLMMHAWNCGIYGSWRISRHYKWMKVMRYEISVLTRVAHTLLLQGLMSGKVTWFSLFSTGISILTFSKLYLKQFWNCNIDLLILCYRFKTEYIISSCVQKRCIIKMQ